MLVKNIQLNLLKKEKDRDKRTELLHNYLKTLNDDLKMKYDNYGNVV